MNSETILKIENISKQYRLGLVGTGTLSHDLNRWWHRIMGKQDPYLQVGETNDKSAKGDSDYVWALKNINIDVKRGEVLGIIGKNGAGKSTLLKILSKVTSPTTGKIMAGGRIASLLEVGTGFHPEMTGRENIFLNGAILGMTKSEIKSKLDEIVDFSGCAKYIDTPVKRYSSGMTVRLAFAVAAHLDPEILIVDEVLAVGDDEFQKKAVGKMKDISEGDGKTVLFVSHNMQAVKKLCNRGLVIDKGEVVFRGTADESVDYYLGGHDLKNMLTGVVKFPKKMRATQIECVEILNDKNEHTTSYAMGEDLNFRVKVRNEKKIDKIDVGILIKSVGNSNVMLARSQDMSDRVFSTEKDFSFTLKVNAPKLMTGDYFITVLMFEKNMPIEILHKCISFRVLLDDVYNTGRIPTGNYINYPEGKWEFNLNN